MGNKHLAVAAALFGVLALARGHGSRSLAPSSAPLHLSRSRRRQRSLSERRRRLSGSRCARHADRKESLEELGSEETQ
jgi:hypothetical protein